ncbi:STAS domain-containing protein [Streptomyces sp. ASQP_92]|uniref:STAS domain-containing protein n=1 Tax=Streptomyces sp. ASQP_92 TaxID=2979116 RepID=UPI0021C1CC03|nr:STAS domain-containing protein [Streptomyces sp. ASQP_92]MCT9092504.1 STAS domain-containing protein [Streptomyces sp. ASQP_92]
MTVYPFTSHAVVHAGVARVTLNGELDLDTAPLVHNAVADCLAERPTTLCFDLTDVSFCDCAGLGALLTARLTILGDGVDLVVEGVGSQLRRLLSLIGAEDFFAAKTEDTDLGQARWASGAVATHRVTTAETAVPVPARDLLR